MSATEFEQFAAAARTCPPGEAYGGPPLIAFAAGRTLPADQPDEFLPSHSSTLAAVNAQIAAARPVCPAVIAININGTGTPPPISGR